MTNQEPMYAPQVPIFPRRVSGYFRRLKWVILIVTLGVYYLTPWIRWDRGANLPNQAVLVDLANSRFYFFWIEIWSHEFYFVAGLLIMAGLGLFLFSSALGRVWCGYTCPQTVWTDLFILVERWIEGDRNARVRLYNAAWNLRKWRLRLFKWAVWMLIAVATGGAWVFYFADAPSLLAALVSWQAPTVAYITIGFLTTTTFIFGGFMREQVCIYACPWPRIQAAMIDPDTITVGYRDWRGEPRGKGDLRKRDRVASEKTERVIPAAGPGQERNKSTSYSHAPIRLTAGFAELNVTAEPKGDCIDCMACVNVCPMGIDIRDGQQMECIACALCIDACDDVMEKIGKPRGLIDYVVLSDEPAERAGGAPQSIWRHILRPRNVLYSVLWSLIGVGMVYALFVRSDIEMAVSPIRNPTFVMQSDGSIRNTYEVRLRNKLGSDRNFQLSLTSEASLSIDIDEGLEDLIINVPANSTLLTRVHVVAERQDAAARVGSTSLRFWAEDIESGHRASAATVFNGKEK